MSAFLIDTSVLADVLTDDLLWSEWSKRQIAAATRGGGAALNPIVYAEASIVFGSIEAFDTALALIGLVVRPIPPPALFLAGRVFRDYRRRGGQRTSILPDFFIGAHAAVEGYTLITRDQRRRGYFPTVTTILP